MDIIEIELAHGRSLAQGSHIWSFLCGVELLPLVAGVVWMLVMLRAELYAEGLGFGVEVVEFVSGVLGL